MNDARNGCEVNEAVQLTPTLSSKSFDHFIRRSKSQGNHKQECRNAKSYKRALDDIARHAFQVEAAVKPDVGHQMKKAIEEGEKAEHPAKLDQGVHTGDLSHRCDGEGAQKEDERQHPGRARHEFKWIRTHIVVIPVPEQKSQRNEGVNEQN